MCLTVYHLMTRLESAQQPGQLANNEIPSEAFKLALDGAILGPEKDLWKRLLALLKIDCDGKFLTGEDIEAKKALKRAEILQN